MHVLADRLPLFVCLRALSFAAISRVKCARHAFPCRLVGWSGSSVRLAWASVYRPRSNASACLPALVSSDARLLAMSRVQGGDFDLHCRSLREMLPYMASCGRVHYVKALHIYLD